MRRGCCATSSARWCAGACASAVSASTSRRMLSPAFTRGRKPPEDDRVADDLKRRLLQDFRTYSLPPLLRYEDRASMAHSLEARLPFLDQELVDYILTLPRSAIIHNGWTRAIVRQALHGVLPAKVEGASQEDRLHDAGVPLVPASARGAAEPHAVAVISRASVLEGGGSGRELPARMRRRGRGVDVLLARRQRRGLAARVHRRRRRGRSTSTAMRAASSARGDRRYREEGRQRRGPARRRAAQLGPPPVPRGQGTDLGALPVALDAHQTRRRSPRGDRRQPRSRARRTASMSRTATCCSISEKALAISQGRSYPIDEIAVSRTARLLSRYVSHEPTGVGLAHPTTMQLAIDEAGAPRILLAAAAAAATKPLGMRGVFYRVAGHGVNAIDGPSSLNLPPYDKWATKSPVDPSGAALRIAADVRRRTGRRVGVAIIDANDMAAEVFASVGVEAEAVLAMIADNPLGQSDEQTPFGLVRRVAPADAAGTGDRSRCRSERDSGRLRRHAPLGRDRRRRAGEECRGDRHARPAGAGDGHGQVERLRARHHDRRAGCARRRGDLARRVHAAGGARAASGGL